MFILLVLKDFVTMEGDTESDVDMQPRHAKAQTETETTRSSRYTNGMVVKEQMWPRYVSRSNFACSRVVLPA